jgi:hypothetical protein
VSRAAAAVCLEAFVPFSMVVSPNAAVVIAFRRAALDGSVEASEKPPGRAAAFRAGEPSAKCADSNDPRAVSAPRAGPVVEVSKLSKPAALTTGFGAGSSATGLVSLKPAGLTTGMLTVAATRGISGRTGLGISIAGAAITGAGGSSKCAGAGRSGRNSRRCGARTGGGMIGVSLSGAINVKCSGAAGNLATPENRIANRRRIARPCTAMLAASDRGDCGALSVGIVNSNNGTSLTRNLARHGRREEGC